MASSSVYFPGPTEARSHHSMLRRSLALRHQQHQHPSYDGQQYPPGLGYHPYPSYYPHELDYSTSTSASATSLGIDLAPGYDDGAYVRHRHHHQHHHQPCPWHQLPVRSSWQDEPQPTWVHHPTHDTAGEDLLPSARMLEYNERLARMAYGLYQSSTTSTTPARRDSLVTSSSDSTSATTSSSSTHNSTTATSSFSSPSPPSSPSSSPTLSTSPSTSPTCHVKKLPPARRSCSATKSPTWRRGPSGLTLCNGCGLRYGQAKKTSRSMAIGSILN
ncbi:GATA zinc finger domain containing protein [Acanthamoeba castellanii str. Neff]|uniref:GATA zinc finger domain containing protein n=1 Tax=Acanthamoeba castellanii (strain ATCC 30010 / Neff) TaxID=1257118 RepID=L8GS28_ACACF|nr:GATA zinc finger domain containing protein [Acanthamoeba castellanii str. Neff]ELR15727.1 GATA zinc finger domain containing protein [Acanthamoeba castellanii str. Neff]